MPRAATDATKCLAALTQSWIAEAASTCLTGAAAIANATNGSQEIKHVPGVAPYGNSSHLDRDAIGGIEGCVETVRGRCFHLFFADDLRSHRQPD